MQNVCEQLMTNYALYVEAACVNEHVVLSANCNIFPLWLPARVKVVARLSHRKSAAPPLGYKIVKYELHLQVATEQRH